MKLVSTSAQPEPAEAQVNILLVDDRPDKLLALEAVLGDLGQNIIKASSGKEALRLLLREEVAVILMDVSMPVMDGFETAALIRKRPKTEHTPIIFITSMSCNENQISHGYSLGAVDYILSPIVPDVLRTKVSVFIELYKRADRVRAESERVRRIEEAEHRLQLAEAAGRLELETKRNRFFTLAIDLLGIADFSGRLLQMNPSWEKTLGFSEEELKMASGLELVHPEDAQGMCEQFNRVRDGETVYFEARYRCKDGSCRWLGWTAAPFLSEKLVYIFARDITARKVSEEEIRLLNTQLSERVSDLTRINKELEAFSYSISHDLRGPLRAMQGFAMALLEDFPDSLADNGKEYARRIMKSAAYMDMLIHDLLDYSVLSRMQFIPVKTSLDTIVSDLLVQAERDIHDKKAEVDVDRPLPEVLAHPPTLRQALTNLFTNALKFVPAERSPRIRFRVEPRGESVRIWVEDNGIGIPAEYHDKIFGLFNRLHPRDSYPGTGIGLALVRQAAERMGGSAGVESRQGEGSSFWIELPAV